MVNEDIKSSYITKVSQIQYFIYDWDVPFWSTISSQANKEGDTVMTPRGHPTLVFLGLKKQAILKEMLKIICKSEKLVHFDHGEILASS